MAEYPLCTPRMCNASPLRKRPTALFACGGTHRCRWAIRGREGIGRARERAFTPPLTAWWGFLASFPDARGEGATSDACGAWKSAVRRFCLACLDLISGALKGFH